MGIVKSVYRSIKLLFIENPFKRYKDLKLEFGSLYARKAVWLQAVAILSDYKINKYNPFVLSYLEEFYKPVIEQYYLQNNTAVNNTGERIPVWVLWWQGLDNAPDIIKVAVASQQQYLNKDLFDYHFLTKDNYCDYVQLDEIILEKMEMGRITFTHFSDILRMELLKKYGGLWLDSTIYMTDDFEEAFYKSDFYTNKKNTYPNFIRKVVSKGRWTGYFLKGNKDNILFCFMVDAFSYYWKKHNTLIDYYLIDYTMDVAYNNIPAVKKMIDEVPNNNPEIFGLNASMNSDYDSEIIDSITSKTAIHKLSYKHKRTLRTSNNKKTIWGYLYEKWDGR